MKLSLKCSLKAAVHQGKHRHDLQPFDNVTQSHLPLRHHNFKPIIVLIFTLHFFEVHHLSLQILGSQKPTGLNTAGGSPPGMTTPSMFLTSTPSGQMLRSSAAMKAHSEIFVRKVQRRDCTLGSDGVHPSLDILGDEHRAPPRVLRGARFGFERGPNDHAAARGIYHTASLLAIAKLVREGDADCH